MRTTFEEELIRKGKIIYPNVGSSMMPLIRQGKDAMIIERPTSWKKNCGDTVMKLKRLDVPLYKRDNGTYVLHRVLKVRKKDYVLCGDHCCTKEYGITDRHIVGILTGVIRDGKELSVKDVRYRMYSHLWCDLYPIRVGILRMKIIIRKIRGKVKHEQISKANRKGKC